MAVEKKSIVKVLKKRHFDLKLFAVKKERTMLDVVDTACKEYLEREAKKEIEKK